MTVLRIIASLLLVPTSLEHSLQYGPFASVRTKKFVRRVMDY